MIDDWQKLLSSDPPEPDGIPRALTFLRRWNSYSHPALLTCDDGKKYVVKGKQLGRTLVPDQIAGRLGRLIGAPVPEVGLVDVPKELIEAEDELRGMSPGIGHASVLLEGVGEKLGYDYTNTKQNRKRFASLAILFGWMVGGDQQFLYSDSEPHLVHSVDHGHFLPGGPKWSIPSPPWAGPAEPDPKTVKQCSLTEAELHEAALSLLKTGRKHIAEAIVAIPSQWGVPIEEKVRLGAFLETRRKQLLSELGVT